MKRFVFISIIIILGGLSILFLALKTRQPIPSCGVKDFEPFCGTENLTENASEGKQIFNANCAACHKLNKNMTGPALKNIGSKYDSTTLIRFLHGEKTLIVNDGYNTKCVSFPQLTNEDILSIIAYTDN